ncbi:MAG TPA: ABC transporter substrate-binding protein [Candidatus Tectomicrobia bacterium]
MSRIPHASLPLARLTRRQFVRAFGLSAVVSTVGVPRHVRAAAPVKIGLLLDLTGALEAYGKPIQNGAILAAEHLNAAGGPLGRRLELVHRDSQTDPTAGIDAAKKLLELDKVVAIVGALSSGVTIPVATSVTIPGGIVQISPASTSPQITDLQDNGLLFRTCPSDALQGKVSGRLAKTLGFQTVSTIYVNNPYGSGLAKTFAQTLTAHGGKVVATVAYEEGRPSYRGELDQALKGKPQAIALFSYPENGVTLIRQALELGFTGKFLLADGMKAPEVVHNVGEQYLKGTYGTTPGAREGNAKARFVEAYTKRFSDKPPKPYIDNCYDAIAVLALAIQHARSSEPKAIRDALRQVANPPGEAIEPDDFQRAFDLISQGQKINYRGASGEVDFDDHGDVVTPIEIWKIDERGMIVTERLEDV